MGGAVIPPRRESPCPAILERLKTDCSRCRGICCTALYYAESEGFPADKEAGKPCAYLGEDFRCAVHSSLNRRGLKGCMAFDCLGAGNRACGEWDGGSREALFARFHSLFSLHQTLWYLAEAAVLRDGEALWPEAEALLNEGADGGGGDFAQRANALLKRVQALCCPKGRPRSPDLIGKRFKGGAAAGLDFSMALLIAADLRGCTLEKTSFLGADLRDANLSGADLRGALFLTPMQLAGARGDEKTLLPPGLSRPETWEAGG